MAGSIGNTHNLMPHEWQAIRSGDNGPWCLCAVDQAAMHPSGGALRVRVLAYDMSMVDVTDEVVRRADTEREASLAFRVAEEVRRRAGEPSRAFPWPRVGG
jgi:hypothetical protein